MIHLDLLIFLKKDKILIKNHKFLKIWFEINKGSKNDYKSNFYQNQNLNDEGILIYQKTQI